MPPDASAATHRNSAATLAASRWDTMPAVAQLLLPGQPALRQVGLQVADLQQQAGGVAEGRG